MPNCGNSAASTALPQPPNTSQKVPRHSAIARLDRFMIPPLREYCFETLSASNMRVRDTDERPTDPIASTAIFRVQHAVHVFGSYIEMADWIPNEVGCRAV